MGLHKEYIATCYCYPGDLSEHQLQSIKQNTDTAVSVIAPPENVTDHKMIWSAEIKDGPNKKYIIAFICRYTLGIADKTEYTAEMDKDILRYLNLCKNCFIAVAQNELSEYDHIEKTNAKVSYGFLQSAWLSK